MEFKLERWEGTDFIITYKNKPVGGTVVEITGKAIVEWLNIAKKELGLDD